jgi:uncharacterized protein (TIGR03437 family)
LTINPEKEKRVMNTLTPSTRLCILLLFCFGSQVSEFLPTRKIGAADRAGNQASQVRSAPAGAEELFTDDGTPEIVISGNGINGNGLICVNRFTPTVYPATLQTIRIFFLPIPDDPAGAQIRLIAFSSGQGPIQPPFNPPLLVDQTVTIPSLPPLGRFIDFPIQNGPTITSGDFYVGFQAPNPNGAVNFPGDLTGQQQGRAYISFNNGREFRPLSIFPELPPTNLMIRAIVANDAGAAPRIEVPPVFSFAYASPGATSERALAVRNVGDAPLNITNVNSNDPQFTVVSFTPPLTIAPGEQGTITLRFSPTATGAQNGILTIASNDPARPSLNIMLSGVGGQPSTSLTLFTNSGASQTGSIIAPASSGAGAIQRPEYAVFVPADASELKIDLSGNQNLALFARFNQTVIPPLGGQSVFDHSSNNPGLTPESISITPSTTPPLRSGLYYIVIANFGPGAANFTLTATVTGGTAPGLATTVSAASFSGPELAREAIVAAYGSGLATSSQAAGSLPLPTDLAGTTIKIRDNIGNERLAPLFFVSPQQANFQIAPGTAGGAAFLTFTSGDGKISTGTAEIVSVAPGIFAANSDGQGVTAAVVCRADDPQLQTCRSVARLDSTLNRFVPAPISLGSANDQFFLLLFGTGIRGRSSLSAVTATIGGTPVMVGFAGAQGGFVGLDQMNLGPLPRSLAGRGELDVVITVDGRVANTVKINIE